MKRKLFIAAMLIGAGAGAALAQPRTQPYLVKDIFPGPDSSEVMNMVAFNGDLYFRAGDGVNGFELWKSDGTTGGTNMVLDIRPGGANGWPSGITAVNNRLYFSAYGVGTGNELWASDGTAAGTVAICDTNPGSESGNPEMFVSAGDNIFFRATNEYGMELWKTDGTIAGTGMVKDIHPGDWSIPSSMTGMNGKLYFSADDSWSEEYGYDRELWVSDGTEIGTYRLKDICPGPAGSIPASLTRLGDAIFFQAGNFDHGIEMWRTDGTTAGTQLFMDFNAAGSGTPMNLTRVGNEIYFIANDGTHGDELWKTDGTQAGTIQVKDIFAGPDSSTPLYFTAFRDGVAFAADDGVHGIELWWTDGTEAGTHLVKDINPGADISSPLYLVDADGELYFVTISEANPDFGTVFSQLWKSDGTEEGTTMVWQAPGEYWGYSINDLTVVGNHLYFTAPTEADEYGFSTNFELYAMVIPEPGSAALLLLAAGTLISRMRRGGR